MVPATDKECHMPNMPNKTEEQSPDCRELTTQELEAIAGGNIPFLSALWSWILRRQAKCDQDPMSCQY
jgi:hypothetical protein